MFRFMVVGATLLAAASTGVAGEHYVEIWNPPEARPFERNVKPSRPPAAHHRVGVHAVIGKRHRVVTATADKAKAPDLAVGSSKREPDFEDIPRQLTPEGNILRVHGRTRIEVER